MGNAIGLILDSDFTGQMVNLNVRDGKALVKRGRHVQEFLLSIPRENSDGKVKWQDVNPIQVKGRMGGSRPMYILKWNSLYPMAFEMKNNIKKYVNPDTKEEIAIEEKTLEVVKPEFKDTKVLPELLGETHDLRFLKGMKKYTAGSEVDMRQIFMFVLGVIILLSVGYLLYYFVFKK